MIEQSENYIGYIERNYWGTVFELFDYGLDQKFLEKIPQFFGTLKKKIVKFLKFW